MEGRLQVTPSRLYWKQVRQESQHEYGDDPFMRAMNVCAEKQLQSAGLKVRLNDTKSFSPVFQSLQERGSPPSSSRLPPTSQTSKAFRDSRLDVGVDFDNTVGSTVRRHEGWPPASSSSTSVSLSSYQVTMPSKFCCFLSVDFCLLRIACVGLTSETATLLF